MLIVLIAVISLAAAGAIIVSLNSRMETQQTQGGRTERYYFFDRLVGERSFTGDQANGPTRTFYPSGTVKSEWEYKDGKRDGTARHYTEEGNLRFLDEYSGDKRVSRKEFDERGNLLSEKKEAA